MLESKRNLGELNGLANLKRRSCIRSLAAPLSPRCYRFAAHRIPEAGGQQGPSLFLLVVGLHVMHLGKLLNCRQVLLNHRCICLCCSLNIRVL